jgi:hypothetical protein
VHERSSILCERALRGERERKLERWNEEGEGEILRTRMTGSTSTTHEVPRRDSQMSSHQRIKGSERKRRRDGWLRVTVRLMEGSLQPPRSQVNYAFDDIIPLPRRSFSPHSSQSVLSQSVSALSNSCPVVGWLVASSGSIGVDGNHHGEYGIEIHHRQQRTPTN